MDDLLLVVDGLDLQHREILLPRMVLLNIGFQIFRGLGRTVRDGIDPVDDFLLRGDGELLIELRDGTVMDILQRGDVKVGDRVVLHVQNKNADRVGLFVQNHAVALVLLLGHDKGDQNHDG